MDTLWSFTDGGGTMHEFELTSISIFTQNNFTLALGGMGIAKIDGFEDTIGYWNFMNNAFGPTQFEFNAMGSAEGESAGDEGVGGMAKVPDGGSTLVLLGCSLLGVVSLRRKFASHPA
ncbi:MAG: VPDSG-CTERM sorting domain-containing protein [Akkermansiaceae bacterium]|nr:VPDSG-CTERM sorting domain-containing protein [Akkermansiaceae bacterium]